MIWYKRRSFVDEKDEKGRHLMKSALELGYKPRQLLGIVYKEMPEGNWVRIMSKEDERLLVDSEKKS